MGLELARSLEPRLAFRDAPDITPYLEEIAQKIADSNKDFPLPEINVALLKNDDGTNATWDNYALPGGHLYLSVGLLKLMKYQNEVAALIAVQLAHLRNEDLLEYFKKKQLKEEADQGGGANISPNPSRLLLPEKINFFGRNGAFSFDESRNLEAARTAVDLLYAAGYDPRGLVALWQTYIDNFAYSPYKLETLKKMLEETRRKIAQKAPLRNPIVRTEGFIQIRQRIGKL
jgi:predicted Zn-dependent protease